MREIFETLADELRRAAAEGAEFSNIDDDSVEILERLARELPPDETLPKSAYARKTPPQDDGEGEFVDDIEEVKFASASDIVKTENQNRTQKKLKVVNKTIDIKPIPAPKKFSLPDGDKQTRWNALREIVLGDKVCAEHLRPEKKIVFGVGALDADIFFCGEAPGADEEIQGEPFVGKAGQLLTKIIGAMGLSREQVYIGNIMNWRPETPKGNRPPTEEEMAYCLPYLKAQIEIVKPKVVVALGMTAVNGLLGFDPSRRMGKIRGHWQKFENADLMVTYHPSFLLQYASPQMKRLVWEDMMAVMERVGIPISAKQRGFFLPKE